MGKQKFNVSLSEWHNLSPEREANNFPVSELSFKHHRYCFQNIYLVGFLSISFTLQGFLLLAMGKKNSNLSDQ